VAKRKRAKAAPTETPPGVSTMDVWKRRVSRAVEMRKDWARKYAVEKTEQFFLGDQETAVVYNHFAATIKTSRPNLYFQTPKFFVRAHPKSAEPVAERTAAIGEGVLEAIARQDDHLETAGNLAVFQSYFRVGVIKICYDPRMEPNPQAGAVIYQTAAGEPVKNPETGESVPVINPMTGKPLTEPAEVLTDEVYRWRWVDAANMLLPDEGPDRSAWTWIGEEVVVRLEDAKNDPRFSEAVRAKLRANASSRTKPDDRSTSTRRSEDAEELLRYNEVYDIRGKCWYAWADGQDDPEAGDFLVDGEPFPSWIDNDPYAILVLGDPIIGPDPNSWPKPVVHDWLPVQQEYNIRRAQINEGAKRSARKVIYAEGAFAEEEEARKALQSPHDMEAAKATDINKVKVLEVPPLSMDIWRDLPALQTDWRIITGQTGARQSDPEGVTATESTFTERAAGLRDADQQKAVIRWMSEAGRKMYQAVKATLTTSMWISLRDITDSELQQYAQRVYQLDPMMLKAFPGIKEALKERFGTEKWQQVTREELQFEADVSVVPGSTRPKNLDAERRQFLEFLKTVGAAPQLLLSRELTRYTAEKFEIHDERLIDELVALAQQMIAVNSNQAGRSGASGGGGGTTASPEIMAGATGGSR
jgi:hypothetical protein